MIIIGLTGSIGMGKTTVARQFSELGIKVSNADAIVHSLLRKGGAAVKKIEKYFPEVVKKGAVDRKALGEIVFNNKRKLERLETILHPMVAELEMRFIEIEKNRGAKMAVLEIPLLFETKAEKRCDIVVVVTAPPLIQMQRVMKRAGMTKEKFERILSLQMPDSVKRKKADVIIETGLGKAHSFKSVSNLVKKIGKSA